MKPARQFNWESTSGSGKPVILNLVYYTCPMLCGEALVGEASALAVLKFTPGKEYEAVTVSFNPDDTPQDAADKKKMYIDRMNEHLEPKTSGEGWHFLTGQKPEIDKLTQAVGFRYRRDPKTGQYIHSTALMIVTPHGKIAQYYYGVEYSPRDIRLGVIEASRNKIGNLVDAVEIYCCRYDPNTGRYDAIISRILSLAGAATVLLLGGFVFAMIRLDKNRLAQGNETGLIDYVEELPAISGTRLGPGRAGGRTLLLSGGGVGILYLADLRDHLRLCRQVPAREPSPCRAD